METNTLKGSNAQFNPAFEGRGLDPIYHSDREKALIIDRVLTKGFGIVKAGTVLSKAYATGELFPYPGTDHLSTTAPGRAFAVANIASGANYIDVPLSQIGPFAVGKSVFLVRNNASAPAYHDGGLITAVNLTQGTWFGRVTFTTALGDALFTVANSANVYLSGGAFTGGLKANCILDIDVDTGLADGVGAPVSILLSNAVLYKNRLTTMDDGAITDLGVIDDAPYIIVK